jgi:transposase
MRKQVEAAGLPSQRIIGIDEISIRKGHGYRIIVSDIEAGRPIWVGDQGRKDQDMDLFFAELGASKAANIKLTVMEMWKPFYNSVKKKIPKSQIIYGQCHIMRHLDDAFDQVRRHEYHRLALKDRAFIQGQRYTLLSHRENLILEGRRALLKLLLANKRLYVAYMLKESFGQLWEYRSAAGARRFFERWRDSLKWQRQKPFEKFAALIDRHWEGIASYCHPENKCHLGKVEGLNNKIRVLQPRAYGYRDEEYLKLKILAAFLPALPRQAKMTQCNPG